MHPVSQTIDEVIAIFADMGFTLAEGPDIEDDFHNFEALNFAPDHPARQMHDTFYLPPAADGTTRLLRTHTSPVQIRTMQSMQQSLLEGAAHPRHHAGPHLSDRTTIKPTRRCSTRSRRW